MQVDIESTRAQIHHEREISRRHQHTHNVDAQVQQLEEGLAEKERIDLELKEIKMENCTLKKVQADRYAIVLTLKNSCVLYKRLMRELEVAFARAEQD
jgi:hypothetical protein